MRARAYLEEVGKGARDKRPLEHEQLKERTAHPPHIRGARIRAGREALRAHVVGGADGGDGVGLGVGRVRGEAEIAELNIAVE